MKIGGRYRSLLILAWCGTLAPGIGCTPADQGAIQSRHRGDLQQPIFYGQTTPTLYTGLTATQQNAVVQLYAPMYGQGFCSGTLISPHIVLTAGHCIHPPDQGEFTAADVTIRIGPDSASPSAELDVQRVAHLDWEQHAEDDVGIAVLSNAYTSVPPLTVKRGGISGVSGQRAQAVGFGMTQDDDPNYPSNTRRYWTTLAVEWVDEVGIVVNGHGSTGVAPGDSGSPLLYDFGNGPQVAGIASTSEQGWIYSANYTSVETQESYVQQFVDQYDNPACLSACAGYSCGESGSCICGACRRGFECQSHQCVEIPAGSGGVCVTLQSTSAQCSASRTCSNNRICYLYGDGSSECGETCGPAACAANDTLSYCLPLPTESGGYINFCIESSPASCASEYASCTTRGGSTGYCLYLDTSGTLRCYAQCTTVATCPDGTGCISYTPPDCAAVCSGLQCGVVDSCSCGQCSSTQRCEANRCVDDCAPDCANRECGDDLCGDVCGECATGDRCNDDGLCVAGASGDGGATSGQHTVSLCGCGQSATAGDGLVPLALVLLAVRRRRLD